MSDEQKGHAMSKEEAHQIFANYATSTAFHLTLSKTQIICLAAVASGGRRYDAFRVLGQPDHSYTAGLALKRRGLVYAPDPKAPGLYELTEAGEHVLELLRLAGLVTKIEGQLQERAA